MRLFFYYAFHSVKNQIKKLFKTWVAIFIVICIAVGVIFGIGGAVIGNILGDDEAEEVTEEAHEMTPDDYENVYQIAELVVAGITLLVFSFNIMGAGKNGSAIFTMSDVNLLFPSPMKPQSVLLFKLLCQLGTVFLVSLYMLFQLPNLVLNLGLNVGQVLLLLLIWVVILIYSNLINVLIYTICSTRERLKKRISPTLYAIVLIIAASFFVYYRSQSVGIFAAAKAFFNAPFTRYIPVYGWIKGLAASALRSNFVAVAIYFTLICIGVVVISYIIWNIKADFYEDAMAKSEETAELAAAVRNGERTTIKRKKDRSERLKRDGLTRGSGATVYFWKAMYNRFRFARFGFFTGTMTTYLAVAVIGGLATRNLLHIKSIAFIVFAFAGIAFFRSLGNPIATDINQVSFSMIPESAHKKVLFSVLGGSANCALDIIPALVVAAIIVGENPLYVFGYACFILSVDFYSTNVGVFLDVSLPSSAGKNIKAMFQILCIYVGLFPLIILAVIGSILKLLPLFLSIAVLFDIGAGFAFFGISPLFIANGKK